MMDKWQGLQSFWESFGIPAYDENSVPDNAEMPYITYQAATGAFEASVPLSASVWYYGTRWDGVSRKVEEISKRLNTWTLVRLDDKQSILLAKSNTSQFAQRMNDEDETGLVKRIYLTLSAEYFTKD